MPDCNLNNSQLSIIKSILSPFASSIEKVGLFGSRATGAARENSDIDMVLYGDISEAEIRRIYTLFLESSLPVKVDVVAYNLVAYKPLKEHIDEKMKTLFTKQDLLT